MPQPPRQKGPHNSGEGTLIEAQTGKTKAQPRNYGVLTDINTRPRTTYIANVINPNMEIGDRTGAPGKSYITGAES